MFRRDMSATHSTPPPSGHRAARATGAPSPPGPGHGGDINIPTPLSTPNRVPNPSGTALYMFTGASEGVPSSDFIQLEPMPADEHERDETSTTPVAKFSFSARTPVTGAPLQSSISFTVPVECGPEDFGLAIRVASALRFGKAEAVHYGTVQYLLGDLIFPVDKTYTSRSYTVAHPQFTSTREIDLARPEEVIHVLENEPDSDVDVEYGTAPAPSSGKRKARPSNTGPSLSTATGPNSETAQKLSKAIRKISRRTPDHSQILHAFNKVRENAFEIRFTIIESRVIMIVEAKGLLDEDRVTIIAKLQEALQQSRSQARHVFAEDESPQFTHLGVLLTAAHFFSYVEHVRDELSPEDTPATHRTQHSSPGPPKKKRHFQDTYIDSKSDDQWVVPNRGARGTSGDSDEYTPDQDSHPEEAREAYPPDILHSHKKLRAFSGDRRYFDLRDINRCKPVFKWIRTRLQSLNSDLWPDEGLESESELGGYIDGEEEEGDFLPKVPRPSSTPSSSPVVEEDLTDRSTESEHTDDDEGSTVREDLTEGPNGSEDEDEEEDKEDEEDDDDEEDDEDDEEDDEDDPLAS